MYPKSYHCHYVATVSHLLGSSAAVRSTGLIQLHVIIKVSLPYHSPWHLLSKCTLVHWSLLMRTLITANDTDSEQVFLPAAHQQQRAVCPCNMSRYLRLKQRSGRIIFHVYNLSTILTTRLKVLGGSNYSYDNI